MADLGIYMMIAGAYLMVAGVIGYFISTEVSKNPELKMSFLTVVAIFFWPVTLLIFLIVSTFRGRVA